MDGHPSIPGQGKGLSAKLVRAAAWLAAADDANHVHAFMHYIHCGHTVAFYILQCQRACV